MTKIYSEIKTNSRGNKEFNCNKKNQIPALSAAAIEVSVAVGFSGDWGLAWGGGAGLGGGGAGRGGGRAGGTLGRPDN